MKYITQLLFVEDKKQKVMYLANPGKDYIEAFRFSNTILNNATEGQKTRVNTYELGAKNWI